MQAQSGIIQRNLCITKTLMTEREWTETVIFWLQNSPAILRLANAMDRSHYQKVEGLRAVLKDRELHLIIDSSRDISLELGLLKDKVEFFEEVFGIHLILRRKRRV